MNITNITFLSPTFFEYHQHYFFITNITFLSPTFFEYHQHYFFITNILWISPTFFEYHQHELSPTFSPTWMSPSRPRHNSPLIELGLVSKASDWSSAHLSLDKTSPDAPLLTRVRMMVVSVYGSLAGEWMRVAYKLDFMLLYMILQQSPPIISGQL